jgi:DNA-binding response OmpR family regulator
MRILLVEDNQRLAELIRQGIEASGHSVDTVHRMADALHALLAFDFELIVLDLGLPDGDGMQLLRDIRSRNIATPCLVLTARDALHDRVDGLDSGADDYLTKPFAMAELIARLQALSRRPPRLLGKTLANGNIALDLQLHSLDIGGRSVTIPTRELTVLESLLRAPGLRCSRRRLEDKAYGMNAEITPNAIEVLMHRLRKRLEDHGANVVVRTIRGYGYAIENTPGT